MKLKHYSSHSVLAGILLAISLQAHAQLTWDASPDPGIQLSAGTWDVANNNWTSDGGATNTIWTNGTAAVFDGDLAADVIVTLSGSLSANGISRVGMGTGLLRITASTGNTLAVSGDVNSGNRLTLVGGDAGAFTGSYNKTGSGSLILDGSNTRFGFGTVTLSAGSIALFNGSPLQSETLILNGGAIGSVNTTARSIDGNVTIGGDIGLGSGTGPELLGGTLNFGSTGTVDLGGATRILTIGSEVNFNGVVSNGGITKEGSGRLALSNIANSLSSAITVNNGELRVSSAVTETGVLNTMGTSAVTVNAGATLRLFTGSTSNAKTYGNAIELNNATLASEDGVHTLTSTISLTGANTINVVWGAKNLILPEGFNGTGSFTKTGFGTLQIGNGGNTGTLGTGAVTISAGTLQISRSNAYTIANDLSGTGTFRVEGTGTTTLTGNNTLAGNNRVLGGGVLSVTTVADGGGVGALGTGAGDLRVAGNSTLRITGTGTQTTNRPIWNNSSTEDGPATFDVVDANASVVFTSNSGNINRPLTKTGAGSLTFNQQIYANASNTVTVNGGTLRLNGTNFYTGATNVNAGTLIISASLANTPVTVADGAALINNGTIGGSVATVGSNSLLTGTGTYNGAVTVGGQLNPGNSPGFQNFSSSLSLGAAAITTIEIGGLTRSTLLSNGINHYDAIDVGAAFALDGTINVTWFGGYEASLGDFFDLLNWGSIDSSNFNLSTDLNLPAFTSPGLSWNTSSFLTNGQISVIPEPAAALLGGIGIMFLLRRRR